jgi:hypothetical protein
MGCGVGMYPLVDETSISLVLNGSYPNFNESRDDCWASRFVMSDSVTPIAPKDINLACLSDMEQLIALSNFSIMLCLDIYDVCVLLLLPHL